MATPRPGRPITSQMAYTNAPVSLVTSLADSSSELIRVLDVPAHAGVHTSIFTLYTSEMLRILGRA